MSFSITKNGITVSGDKMVEVFKELADLQEIFSNDQCGKCQNKELKFIFPNKNTSGTDWIDYLIK